MEDIYQELLAPDDAITPKVVVVSSSDAGQKLGDILMQTWPESLGNRKQCSKARKAGEILVNGTVSHTDCFVEAGDEVTFARNFFQHEKRLLPPLEVCYEDSHIAIIWKTPGVSVLGEGTSVAYLALFFLNKSPEEDALVPIPLGRMQRSNWGLVLIVKTVRARSFFEDRALFQPNIRTKDMEWTYTAICQGKIECNCIFDDILDGEEGKTHCKVLKVTGSNMHNWLSTVELRVEDEILHQARRHVALRGNQVLGDPDYGNTKVRGKRMFYALTGITFCHPIGGFKLTIEHPEPDKFETLRMREEKFWTKKMAVKRQKLHEVGIDEARLNEGLPLAYITGSKTFCGLPFNVSSDVLIPRVSTEVLVRSAVEILRDVRTPRILDLGCGCGNILLSCLHQIPDARGVGLDLSAKAVAIANDNAAVLGLSSRSLFVQGDFGALGDPEVVSKLYEGGPFDIVICNPPYMDPGGEHLSAATKHEPRLALFAANKGLAAYESIRTSLEMSKPHGLLKTTACLVVEVGGTVKSNFVAEIFGIDRVVDRILEDNGWVRCLVLTL